MAAEMNVSGTSMDALDERINALKRLQAETAVELNTLLAALLDRAGNEGL